MGLTESVDVLLETLIFSFVVILAAVYCLEKFFFQFNNSIVLVLTLSDQTFNLKNFVFKFGKFLWPGIWKIFCIDATSAEKNC